MSAADSCDEMPNLGMMIVVVFAVMVMVVFCMFVFYIFGVMLDLVLEQLKSLAQDAGLDAVVVAELPITQKCTDLQFAAPVL
ncbi:MAG: hypothetical protein KDA93_22920, partial [Planctomycetaceae bacterium]|nr:hypothetical protein [Planctomycetaceae bacterium]